MVIPIHLVVLNDSARSTIFTRKMKKVLERQGQIEPLQVKPLDDGRYEVFGNDPHGADILVAALELGWDNILILPTQKWIA